MRLSISKLPRPLGALLFSSFLAFQAGAASPVSYTHLTLPTILLV